MTHNFFFVLYMWQDEKHLSSCYAGHYAGCMSHELCNRPHSLWSLSGSVVKHWSVESEGLRFNSSWGLRILFLSYTCDETINIFLYIFPINKLCKWALRSYATGIYIIVYWSYFTQYFRLWTFWSPYLKKRKKKI